MSKSNKLITNMVGGEVSPQMFGRSEIQLYSKAMAKVENFIILPTGGARFRNGTMYVKQTRQNKPAVFIPFQFNDSQSYLIEATDQKFRFYTSNSAVLETAKTITGIASGVVTSTSHGFSNGDEVYIDNVGGATEFNGRFFIVSDVTTHTFTVNDVFNRTATPSGLLLALTKTILVSHSTYTSGGTVARVYEISTPYVEADLETLQYAQNADTMYFAHQNYAPRKLLRSANTSWSLATYTRTADPFTSVARTITAITQANPGVVTSAAHGFTAGQSIVITAVVGMTELNSNRYYVAGVTTNTFTLADSTGATVDTTAYTAYTSDGTATSSNNNPGAVCFLDSGRLMFGGTTANPQTVYASKAPSSGATDFDNFTTGSNATDAIIFTLQPIHGKVDAIQWMTNTSKVIALGTYGALRILYGSSPSEPISPTSVTAKSANSIGCARTIPISNGDGLFFIQRGTKSLRSVEYDFQTDQYLTTDRNLVAEHITNPAGFKHAVELQGAASAGMPDAVWATMNDGKISTLIYKDKETVSGWCRSYLGGAHDDTHAVRRTFGKALWAGVMPRTTNGDQLWFIVERVIGNSVVRSVEYVSDEPAYPQRNGFLSGIDATDEATDDTTHRNQMFETQKDGNHLDMAIAYDGTAYGTAAEATITPSAATGTIDITASTPVFTSSMVGRQIWKQYDINGNGGGRATIASYISTTRVTATVTVDFDNANPIAYSNWLLTATALSGLGVLEGETVSVVTDGGPANDATVTNGAITLSSPASKVFVGYPYRGVLETLSIDSGGVTGSAEAKLRKINEVLIRFKDTVGPQFGTSEYKTERLVFPRNQLNRPTQLFNGIFRKNYNDGWDREKKFVIIQDRPLPCTVLSIDAFMDTTDE